MLVTSAPRNLVLMSFADYFSIYKDAFFTKNNLYKKEYMGYRKDGQLYPRRTFTSFYSQQDLQIISAKLDAFWLVLKKALYTIVTHDELLSLFTQKESIKQIVKKNFSRILFDYVRLDTFYDTVTKQLSILEINAKKAELHDFLEYMDLEVADILIKEGIPFFKQIPSLNEAIVITTKDLYEKKYHKNPLFVVTVGMGKPWIFQEKIQQIYKDAEVIFINIHEFDTSRISINETGVYLDNKKIDILYLKNSRKFWKNNKLLQQLQADNLEAFQTYNKYILGNKQLLTLLTDLTYQKKFAFTLQERQLIADLIPSVPVDQIQTVKENKDQYVIKIAKGGMSRNVYIGKITDNATWDHLCTKVYMNPEKWTIQRYIMPHPSEVIIHEEANISQFYPTLLQIFAVSSIKDDGNASYIYDYSPKIYTGTDQAFTFDPTEHNPNLLFGNVIITA